MRYKDLLYKVTNFSFLSVLNASNPFYLMLDKKGVILSAGDHFKLATNDELEGKLFPSFFKFNSNITFFNIQNDPKIVDEIEQMDSLCCTQQYKTTIHHNEEYIFIFASPIINEKIKLSNYKIHLNQVPTHDYLSDFIKMQEKPFTNQPENTNLTGTLN